LRGGSGGDFRKRHFQIDVDVVAQRLERRDVDDFGLVGKRPEAGGAHQAVEAQQKGGQRLAGACGGGDEDVMAGANPGPAQDLRFGGGGESLGKPVAHQGVETGERGGRYHLSHFSDSPGGEARTARRG
jgi:hypothetical protein